MFHVVTYINHRLPRACLVVSIVKSAWAGTILEHWIPGAWCWDCCLARPQGMIQTTTICKKFRNMEQVVLTVKKKVAYACFFFLWKRKGFPPDYLSWPWATTHGSRSKAKRSDVLLFQVSGFNYSGRDGRALAVNGHSTPHTTPDQRRQDSCASRTHTNRCPPPTGPPSHPFLVDGEILKRVKVADFVISKVKFSRRRWSFLLDRSLHHPAVVGFSARWVTVKPFFLSNKGFVFPVTSDLVAYAWNTKYRRKQKLIIQFSYKSRDESFDLS